MKLKSKSINRLRRNFSCFPSAKMRGGKNGFGLRLVVFQIVLPLICFICVENIQAAVSEIPSGVYKITALHSGKVLDVIQDRQDDSAPIHQWQYLNQTNQQWRVERQTDGTYRLTAQHSGKVLEAAGAGTADGTAIQQYVWNDSCAQKWRIENRTDNAKTIRSSCGDKVLDVSGVSLENGAPLQLWSAGGDGSRNQAFVFEVVGDGEMFQFSADFSSEQGRRNWFYLYRNAAANRYEQMVWTNGEWKGREPFSVIGERLWHPANDATVVMWKAPVAGRINISGGMRSLDERTGGIIASIWKGDTRLFPQTGEQRIPPGREASHVVYTSVAAGDEITFRLEQDGAGDFDSTAWDPIIKYQSTPPPFTLDRTIIAVSRQQLEAMRINLADSPLHPIPGEPNSGNLEWIHSGGGADGINGTTPVNRFRGTLENPAQQFVSVSTNAEYWRNPNNIGGRKWSMNIYKDSPSLMIAVVHIEYGGADSFRWRMGLGKSTDNGQNWTFLGEVVHAETDPPMQTDYNIGGGPFAVKDGFFHLFYRDLNGAGVARAPLAEVVQAAENNTVPQFRKLFNNDWNEPGNGGRAQPLNDSGSGDHNDLAFSTVTGKFYQVVMSQGFNEVHLLESTDLITWNDLGAINAAPVYARKGFVYYLSIVNEDGTDNGQVGNKFYVYFARTDLFPLYNFYRTTVTLTGAAIRNNDEARQTRKPSVKIRF
jgi:hypothetical protein